MYYIKLFYIKNEMTHVCFVKSLINAFVEMWNQFAVMMHHVSDVIDFCDTG